MTFERTAATKIVEVSVWDDDPGFDDLIGKGEMNIIELCKGNCECEMVTTVAIKKENGDNNGTVDIKLVFSFKEWVEEKWFLFLFFKKLSKF